MTTDDDRDLAQALFRTLYDAGVSFQSGDLIPRLTATVRAAGFRRQGPITDERVWTCALCGKPPEQHAMGGAADDCLYEPVLRGPITRSAVPSTTEQESDR